MQECKTVTCFSHTLSNQRVTMLQIWNVAAVRKAYFHVELFCHIKMPELLVQFNTKNKDITATKTETKEWTVQCHHFTKEGILNKNRKCDFQTGRLQHKHKTLWQHMYCASVLPRQPLSNMMQIGKFVRYSLTWFTSRWKRIALSILSRTTCLLIGNCRAFTQPDCRWVTVTIHFLPSCIFQRR